MPTAIASSPATSAAAAKPPLDSSGSSFRVSRAGSCGLLCCGLLCRLPPAIRARPTQPSLRAPPRSPPTGDRAWVHNRQASIL